MSSASTGWRLPGVPLVSQHWQVGQSRVGLEGAGSDGGVDCLGQLPSNETVPDVQGVSAGGIRSSSC